MRRSHHGIAHRAPDACAYGLAYVPPNDGALRFADDGVTDDDVADYQLANDRFPHLVLAQRVADAGSLV